MTDAYRLQRALDLAHWGMWRCMLDPQMYIRGVNPGELHGVLTGAHECKDCATEDALDRLAHEKWPAAYVRLVGPLESRRVAGVYVRRLKAGGNA